MLYFVCYVMSQNFALYANKFTTEQGEKKIKKQKQNTPPNALAGSPISKLIVPKVSRPKEIPLKFEV